MSSYPNSFTSGQAKVAGASKSPVIFRFLKQSWRVFLSVSAWMDSLNRISDASNLGDNLMKAVDEQNDRMTRDNNYYEKSIADMVKREYPGSYANNHRHQSVNLGAGLPPPAFTLGSNAEPAEVYRVSGLNFEMWVSPPNQNPDQLEQSRLHSYTRLQYSHSSPDPIPLENLENWRYSFPLLTTLLEDQQLPGKYDVILLEASFELMQDFPPRSSKLGIGLELDFGPTTIGKTDALHGLHEWTCTTHMYQHGQRIAESRRACHASMGKVKPTFESIWWANTFIQLTEKKRRAEDSRNEAAIEAASETSRNFFHGLSVMQELTAYPSKDSRGHATWTDQRREKRVAILLWKFSQAHSKYVGTTTWQRLIPPPDRTLTNSPAPAAQDLALPPLAMDTIVEDMHNTPDHFANLTNFHQDSHQQYPLFQAGIDDHAELTAHDGFEMVFREEDIASFVATNQFFDPHPSQAGAINPNLHDLNNFDFDLQPHEINLAHLESSQMTRNNSFETYQPQHEANAAVSDQTYGVSELAHHDPADQAHRHPLTTFDHNTHQMLQAQLAQDKRHSHDDDEEALRAALVAASAINDLSAQGTSHRTTLRHREMNEQQGFWDAGFIERPLIPHHNRYANQHEQHPMGNEKAATKVNGEAFVANHLVAALNEPRTNSSMPASPRDRHDDSHAHLFANKARSAFGPESATRSNNGVLGDSFVEVKLEGAESPKMR